MKPKVIVIAGPTASGKTSLSVALAKQINGEIVSCDSMQIYKDMTIGTAKPLPEEMDGINHHLIDFVSPDERYSDSLFSTNAGGYSVSKAFSNCKNLKEITLYENPKKYTIEYWM